MVDEPTDFLFRDDFLAGILGQLSMSLARENLLPFLILAEPDNAKGFEQLLHRSGAEGVVVASFHEGRKFADMLKRFDKPTVFIGSPPKGFKCPYVDVDNYDGGYQAVNCWWNAAAGTLPLSRDRAICPRRRNVRPDSVPR